MLGETIGKVEEVDADEEGECIGQYARVRISIDITQPLKKIIYIEHARGEEISIPVVYERLPEFYFCCGRIGHPYKECDKYEGQPKDELAYRVWMQVVQFYGKPRVNRSHERGNMVVANWPITQQRQGTKSKGEILTLNIKSPLNGTRPMKPQANQAPTKKTYTWQSIKMALRKRWGKIN